MYHQTYSYIGFEPAYIDTLNHIRTLGTTSSPRGRTVRELFGYQFTITNPRQRLLGFKSRKINLFYCIGNFLWVMSQSDDVNFINYYNTRAHNFSDDGQRLPAAYGKRIFDIDGINQYYQAIRELKLDPDSRRALISIYMPQHDLRGVLDTSCTADFQFFIRDGKLNMINHMRSQSAAMVMPYDTFLMTMILEYTSCILGLEMGYYQNFCGNIHYFQDEQKRLVDVLIDEEEMTLPMMKLMPKETNEEILKKVLKFERTLRNEAWINDVNTDFKLDEDRWLLVLDSLGLPEYWKNICYILIARAMDYTGKTIIFFNNKYISPEYQEFLR